MYRTSTGLALKKTAQELDKAVAEATPQNRRAKLKRRPLKVRKRGQAHAITC